MNNYIWIIEMWNEDDKRWEPTVGAQLSRADAVDDKENWQTLNPDDKFRIAVYKSKLNSI